MFIRIMYIHMHIRKQEESNLYYSLQFYFYIYIRYLFNQLLCLYLYCMYNKVCIIEGIIFSPNKLVIILFFFCTCIIQFQDYNSSCQKLSYLSKVFVIKCLKIRIRIRFRNGKSSLIFCFKEQ